MNFRRMAGYALETLPRPIARVFSIWMRLLYLVRKVQVFPGKETQIAVRFAVTAGPLTNSLTRFESYSTHHKERPFQEHIW